MEDQKIEKIISELEVISFNLEKYAKKYIDVSSSEDQKIYQETALGLKNILKELRSEEIKNEIASYSDFDEEE